MKLVAPNYLFTVTADGSGVISLHDASGTLIGSLSDHRPPALGNDADALWDAAEWLLMAPQDGHGVEPDFWDQYAPAHYAWLCGTANREDIIQDFAEAAALMGSLDAAYSAGLEVS